MEKDDFFILLDSLNISSDLLSDIAFETGLIKRKRLLGPSDILYITCKESISGTVSYNDLAAVAESKCGVVVSRQAICKKATSSLYDFFKKVFEHILLNKIDKGEIEALRFSNSFNRILVQDSTIIRLPIRLFEIFSGVANGSTKVCNARIQGTFDILAEKFIAFSIDPYSKNDIMSAPETHLQKNDLVLRDRGYLKLDEVQRHINNEAHCIYRHLFKMVLLNPISKEPIDIIVELKKNKELDIEVMLNNKDKTIVRLVASAVDDKIANSRRRKAKKEKKTFPSKEYLELMAWSIYITTIPKEQANYAKIFSMYSYRWRIEIIFKNWKSNMEFNKIHNVSAIQLSVLLLARFIMIIIYTQIIFRKCRTVVKKYLNKNLSLLKVTHYLKRNPDKIIDIFTALSQGRESTSNPICILAKYCSYDTRNRKNYEQQMDKLYALS